MLAKQGNYQLAWNSKSSRYARHGKFLLIN